MVSATSAPANSKTFEHISFYRGYTAAQCFAFHAAPGAFGRLTPPPIMVQMHRNDIQGLVAGDVEFTLWMGPIPVRWHAQHAPGINATSFVDFQVSGPMAYWYHEHMITDKEGGVELRDRIRIAHKPGIAGILTRLLFDGLPLRFLFIYRHLRTRWGMTKM
ncbi:MAG: cyclase [Chloroflexota bacterium]|nr:cyclase [Chloroflexota bacterium]